MPKMDLSPAAKRAVDKPTGQRWADMLVLAGIVLLITSPFLMMLGLMLLYAGLALMWYLRRKRRRA